VLIDLGKGTSTPITADIFTQQRGRNRFIAFQTGPFARVNADGDCLNVREQAATSAASLACYGTASSCVTSATRPRLADVWLKVATPDAPRLGQRRFLDR
jgi:hypothetical protein